MSVHNLNKWIPAIFCEEFSVVTLRHNLGHWISVSKETFGFTIRKQVFHTRIFMTFSTQTGGLSEEKQSQQVRSN